MWCVVCGEGGMQRPLEIVHDDHWDELLRLATTPSVVPFSAFDDERRRIYDIVRKSGIGLVSLPPKPPNHESGNNIVEQEANQKIFLGHLTLFTRTKVGKV